MKRKQKSANLLCIFTRFPQAGKCKTRLIPKLGAEGAADLQRQMTGHILRVGQQCCCDLLVCIDGGCPDEIRSWLGADIDYIRQQGADLGARMSHCFVVALGRGYQNVILVGSDCPAMDSPFLEAGFQGLATHDLVFGPTLDGGYCLLGMKSMHLELFIDMVWGTHRVMAQSLRAVSDFSVMMLPALNDVDSSEDLSSLPASFQGNRF